MRGRAALLLSLFASPVAYADESPARPPSYRYAAQDIYPVGDRERELCEEASRPDWLYLGGLAILVTNGFLVSHHTKSDHDPPRWLGPMAIGFSWGAALSGGYLALPKCRMHFVSYPPREGDVRSDWARVVGIAGLAAFVGPIMTGIATGPLRLQWSTEERAQRLLLAGGFGMVGSLVPYLLPPRTVRNARILEKLRLGGEASGFTLGVGGVF